MTDSRGQPVPPGRSVHRAKKGVKLAGKTAVVTGAGRGIGRGVAIELAAEGARTLVASRSPETVDAVVANIGEAGGESIGVVCDVNNKDDVQAAITRAMDEWGAVDILVNNAQGSFGTPAAEPGALETLDIHAFMGNFRGGPLATLWAMQAAFPYMREHGGRIINFGSLNGLVGRSGTAPYNAAKEAVRALSRTAAREWGQYGITVNVINPTILSDSTAALVDSQPEFGNWLVGGTPLGRIGEPWEVGRIVAFLASEAASYITGVTFMVDRGRIMGSDAGELRYPPTASG